jgi:adenosine deaminase
MPAHPLPIIMNNGVPVALNSDDPAIFGNLTLSYDYFQVPFYGWLHCLRSKFDLGVGGKRN